MTEYMPLGYIDFLVERQKIWSKSKVDKLPKPWTDDPILQKAKFCNVYRELDRVTIDEHSIIDLMRMDLKAALRTIMLIRRANNVKALYLESCNPKDTDLVSDSMICWEENMPRGLTQFEWLLEFRKIVERNLEELFTTLWKEPQAGTIFKHIYDVACKQSIEPYPEFNRLYAYEVYTSLTNQPGFRFSQDHLMYMGPGAMPMLQHLCGTENLKGTNIGKNFHDFVKTCLINNPEFIYLPYKFQLGNFTYSHKFTFRDLEHSLCEYRKYLQIYSGKPIRRPYNGVI